MLAQGIYEFYLNITELNDSVIMTYGNTALSSARSIIPLRRFCLLDNVSRRPVYLEMVIWR